MINHPAIGFKNNQSFHFSKIISSQNFSAFKCSFGARLECQLRHTPKNHFLFFKSFPPFSHLPAVVAEKSVELAAGASPSFQWLGLQKFSHFFTQAQNPSHLLAWPLEHHDDGWPTKATATCWPAEMGEFEGGVGVKGINLQKNNEKQEDQ